MARCNFSSFKKMGETLVHTQPRWQLCRSCCLQDGEKVFSTILVCSGCPDRTPQTAWHKQEFICSEFAYWKFKITVSAGFVSPKTSSFLELQMAASLLCPHMASSLCTQIPGVSSSSYKDTNQGHTRVT